MSNRSSNTIYSTLYLHTTLKHKNKIVGTRINKSVSKNKKQTNNYSFVYLNILFEYYYLRSINSLSLIGAYLSDLLGCY